MGISLRSLIDLKADDRYASDTASSVDLTAIIVPLYDLDADTPITGSRAGIAGLFLRVRESGIG